MSKFLWSIALSFLVVSAIAISLFPRNDTVIPVPTKISFASNVTTTEISIKDQQIQFLRTKAVDFGINPDLAECIVQHESQFQDRYGDDGTSRGYWQISSIWHPEVSDATSFSFTSSTLWALPWIASGHVTQWTTYRQYCTMYPVYIPPLTT